ncbi:hypothetical protein BH10PLA2_BH10PLA2_23790 [soil metagenome]
MTPWWTDPQAGLVGGVAGSVLGILGGVWGTLVGIGASRGKWKPIVYGLSIFMVGTGVACLFAAIVALAMGQPFFVYYPLGLIGLISTAVIGAQMPMVRKRYQEADNRRLEAEGFRRG